MKVNVGCQCGVAKVSMDKYQRVCSLRHCVCMGSFELKVANAEGMSIYKKKYLQIVGTGMLDDKSRMGPRGREGEGREGGEWK